MNNINEEISIKEKELDNMYKRYYVETRENIRCRMFNDIQNLRYEISALKYKSELIK